MKESQKNEFSFFHSDFHFALFFFSTEKIPLRKQQGFVKTCDATVCFKKGFDSEGLLAVYARYFRSENSECSCSALTCFQSCYGGDGKFH
ncbi:hypothetical protein MPTK1_6g01000 [Marchantia polymorpha subsp. ruderalis]|uniref:Uncharacterized protein n=2 Tax=Marchantia polymorpha TaxID=3197 RepID=A0AAF6BM89_MARPO|nr:hypothetical protein MARPO_0052s0104 [Marchantia polymorpha]BBN13123.1 hypothetical protein Mp_6g01000 [Marchantia polymorpha subsp. ruderalis]|eukprot:PTQ38325.1 hypothetical protein MARPO_0052s0104 [Marchantia polymorpha]